MPANIVEWYGDQLFKIHLVLNFYQDLKMEPIEEKILVAQFLGYGVKSTVNWGYVWSDTFDTYETHHHFDCTFGAWNPQDNETGRQWWDEIWGKMSEQFSESQWQKYFTIIVKKDYGDARNFRIAHTAVPGLCWKALIPVLENI